MNTVFKKYKNIHEGKRVFLIANGPSLAYTNLDLIKDEISIAMNKVSLIYSKNKLWRPTYYMFSSTNVNSPQWGQSWIDAVREASSEERSIPFIAGQFRSPIDPNNTIPRINWFNSMSETKPSAKGDVQKSCFSTNIIERIDKSGTTMNLALQLTYHMGFSEVIFLGADLGFTMDTGSKCDPNHFDESYRANVSRPEKANNQMRNIHSLAYRYFLKRDNNVKFYNASLKTCLDVYPIIDYKKYILHNNIVLQEDKLKQAKSFWRAPHQYIIKK
tara:strand:+ start:2993 stop:3811 length:819 start_codon:yes stop_codon:yes gene_type:complete